MCFCNHRSYGSTFIPEIQAENLEKCITCGITSPEKNFNACDDFFKLLVPSYVLAASMEIFEMESLKSLPVLEGITDVDTIWAMTDKEREDILNSICDTFLDKFLCFELNKKPSATNDKVIICSI